MEEEQFQFSDLFNFQTLQKLMVPFAFLIVILYNFCWKKRSAPEENQMQMPRSKKEAEELISKKINNVSRSMRNDDGEIEEDDQPVRHKMMRNPKKNEKRVEAIQEEPGEEDSY